MPTIHGESHYGRTQTADYTLRHPIRMRLTDQLVQAMQGLQSAALVASLGVLLLLWEYVPLTFLGIWLLARLAVEAGTVLLSRAYLRDNARHTAPRIWLRRYGALHIADACTWGSCALFLLWPMPELMKLFLVSLVLVDAVILLASMSAFYRLYWTMLAIMIAPFAVMLIAQSLPVNVSTMGGIAALCIWGYLARLGRRTHQHRVKTLRAELSHNELSRQLNTERDKRRQIQQRLIAMTDYDALTGLPNQWQFFQRAQRQLDSLRDAQNVAIILINLREFTQVNATLGRAAGDYVLAQIGGRLQALLPPSAVVSRIGNDEFAVAITLPRALGHAQALIKRIQAEIAREVQWEDNQIEIASAVGYSLAPEHGKDIETVMKKADIALRDAKAAPAGHYTRFNPAMEARAVNRFALQHALRRALTNNELELVYQPLVDLDSGRITGAEALLRWRHPELGPVPPADFIPLAEQSGQINEIGAWALREACRQAALWQRTWEGEFSISVNVSVQQLADRNFPRLVEQALHDSGLPAAALRLEITETVIMVDPDSVLPLLDGIRGLGVQIALDDFGTGYSSLSYLTQMNIDYLKLDKSFIRDIGTAQRSATIVRSVIALASALQLKVVAEGIETLDDWRRLRANGCAYGQGYFFSRPLRAADFEHLPRAYRLDPMPHLATT